MHNSDKIAADDLKGYNNKSMKRRKYLKRSIAAVLFILAFMLGNSVLDFLFIPYSYVEVDYSNVYNNKYDTVIIGTSHGKCGIDPETIDVVNGGSSVNMCLGGEYLSYSYYMVRDICRNFKPKKIVYELDPGYWVTDEYLGTDSALIFNNMEWSVVKADFYLNKLMKEDFRLTVFPWYIFRKEYKMIPTNVKNKSNGAADKHKTDVFASVAQSYEKNGFIYRNPVNDADKTWTNFEAFDEKKVNSETLKYFRELVNYCKDQGIELEVIITPAPDETVAQYSEEYKNCNKYFTELTDKYDVEFYDFNYTKLDGVNTKLEAYCDHEGHFNGEAAKVFSEKLAPYIR